jgi:integrase
VTRRRRGHGEGTIYHRPDGRWEAVVDLGWQDGKRHRKYLYGRTRREVAEKLARALRARQEHVPFVSERTTVEQFLQAWLKTVEPSLHPRTFLRRSICPLLDRAGLPPIRFHDLRHSAATLLLGLGIHPKIVSELLGHSQVGITLDLYSHVTATMQQEAVRAFEGLLGSQLGSQLDTPQSNTAAGARSSVG